MKKVFLVIITKLVLAMAVGGCATKGDLEAVEAREKAMAVKKVPKARRFSSGSSNAGSWLPSTCFKCVASTGAVIRKPHCGIPRKCIAVYAMSANRPPTINSPW